MKKDLIVIIDYDMGNIRSILNKLKRAGYNGTVTDNIETIKSADKLILPGVGHFLKGIIKLKEKNLVNVLNTMVCEKKTPILGICLGMQLITRHSEEGDVEGLNWIDAETIKFRLNDVRHKVPHMGWNSVEIKKDSPLFEGILPNSSFYFVHSYHVVCHNYEDVLTTTKYGYEFVSSFQKENIYGAQFHPEKSHESGERLLCNFLNL